MATPWTHAFFALAAGKAVARGRQGARVWLALAACATIPDLDVLSRRFGVDQAGIWGHRGITHSLLAAVLIGLLAALIVRRKPPAREGLGGGEGAGRETGAQPFLLLWLTMALATASHGFLDMLTSGYRGVALLAPFSGQRFSFPWQPIWNIPGWLTDMLPAAFRGGRPSWLLRATLDEVLVVWLPMTALAALSLFSRARTKSVRVPAGK